jgi:hypothetical protein
MHELPATAWILIACSTLPWLLLTILYCLKNAARTESASHDEPDR